ncbi:protein phosphatase 2C domain-containing protein [Crossiella cryophila]|uniref:Protein phosphatase 2C n=1 Tax=Crossiella cryophila TaxID=43355 RepID=A0A7W7FR55_9PSEU|nr:protein phosphatase 2C domain-containing protein [Crossiella cryophila]MBB4674555.1 hypothetical protein [Crossiella cryophila]
MPAIEMAERAGVHLTGGFAESEDRIVVLPNAVVLLDGATRLEPGRHTGGWYAERLADRLRRQLTAQPDIDLAELLAACISQVAADHDLEPGKAPSSTVALLRWDEERVDALVLADSPVVAFTVGDVHVLNDTRLANLSVPRRTGYREQLRDGAGFSGAHVDALRASATEVGQWRNREGGFWVAEADPVAAKQAMRAHWMRDQVQAVVMASDGVSCGVEDYGVFTDWTALYDQAVQDGLHTVLDAVRKAEESDPDGRKWPRPKRHDDQSLVVVHFDDDWFPRF